MRILFLSSEVAPWSKTGGLGDVAGALPAALAALGHEVRVVTPLYRGVSRANLEPEPGALTLSFPFGEVEARFAVGRQDHGLSVVFVDIPAAFDRGAHYGHGDDAHRFAAYGMAALSWAQRAGFDADAVHCNDWQTGLVPLALRRGYAHTPLGAARTVFTIHNLAYQGNFAKGELDGLGIPWSEFTLEGVEFYNQLGFMKTGLQFADVLTTVSPSYAREIQTREGGVGLDGVLRSRARDLHGILNGVDAREWNPATDVLLPARFSAADLEGRATCHRALLGAYQLDEPANDMPVFGIVGRMVDQKGADLMQHALPRLLEQGACAVVLGSGDLALENAWRALHARFPRRLGVRIGFDNSLAHLVEAGSDFFLMPSRFEPCGLNQMYSLLYGAVPIVRAVGGLRDTVVDFTHHDGTGVVFDAPTTEALFGAMVRAVELFRDRAHYERVRRRGMGQDFSWTRAAHAYERLYAR